jgi:uncharacterized iron-regulated membrane protein
VSLFTLFLLISGLPWALVWGSAFKELRSIGKPAVEQGWVISEHAHHTSDQAQPLALTQNIVDQAQALAFAFPAELSVDKNSQWKLSSQNQNRTLRADAWFDAQTGKLENTSRFADRPLIDRIIGIGISAHEGHLFGWINQLLGLIVALGLITVSVSGFILWRKRKPQGNLGAPPYVANPGIGATVLGITLLLAAVLPVLAASLILLLILEKGVLQRIPSVRNWLGLGAH